MKNTLLLTAALAVLVSQNAVAHTQGAYVGLQGGVNGTLVTGDTTITNLTAPDVQHKKLNAFSAGLMGGFHGGYGWRVNQHYLALDAAFNMYGGGAQDRFVADSPVVSSFNLNPRYTTQVSGKWGYVMGDWMPYVRLGVSYGKLRGTAGFNNNTLSFSSTKNAGLWGALGGVGVSYAVNKNWRVAGEVTYTRYNSLTQNFTQTLSGSNYQSERTVRPHVGEMTLKVSYAF